MAQESGGSPSFGHLAEWWQRQQQDPGVLSPPLELIHPLHTLFPSADDSHVNGKLSQGKLGLLGVLDEGGSLLFLVFSFRTAGVLVGFCFCFRSEKCPLLLGCGGSFKKQQKTKTFAPQMPGNIGHWLPGNASFSFTKKINE